MAIITLTTDFGYKDPYVSALKGSIYSELAQAHLVDISHEVTPFDTQECAYIVKNAFHYFPEGSIHLIGVDAEATPENQHLVVLLQGHYFILANNGIIELLMGDQQPEKVYSVALPNAASLSFPEIHVLAKVACHLARGGTLEVIGKPFEGLKGTKDFEAHITDNGRKIQGSIEYIDNYGNIITNIDRHLFEAYRNGRDFEILIRDKKITEVYESYSGFVNFELEKSKRKGPGDFLALFNSAGVLEFAIYKSNAKTVGGARTLIGLKHRDPVTIIFN